MQTFTGKVILAKTPKTVTVEFAYFQKHPKYKKIVKKTTKLLVHNELENVGQGDLVSIIKSRPYSKNKHFRVVEVLSKGTRPAAFSAAEPEKKEIKKEVKKKTVKKSI